MQILHHRQIEQKIKRLAIEILERNTQTPALMIAGVNRNGMQFARLLLAELQPMTDAAIVLTNIVLNPANPLAAPIEIGMPLSEMDGKPIIVVDDVANTGRTLFYACKPLLDILPSKLEIAVLVDRTHKTFPVKVDYFGISLATTLHDNIRVDLSQEAAFSVDLG